MLTLPNVTQAEIDAVASISKDKREELMAKINAADPHLIFTPALSKSTNENVHAIICPRCANGSGENHTPVEVELINGKWIYNCFRGCGFQGDLLGIIADNSGLNLKSFNGLCEAIAIGLKLVGDNLPDEIPAPNPKSAAEIEFEEREKNEIKGDIEYAQKHLGDLPIRQERGLSFETMRHFGCGFIKEWQHPKTRLSGKNSPSSRRLIIPTGDSHYNAVALPADRPNMPKKFWKMHAGKMSLFGLETVGEAEIVVIVEGEIDAMSIWQASKGKTAVIAILGAANWQATLAPVLTTKFTSRKFVILFDGDDTGKNNATKLANTLTNRFFVSSIKFLTDFLSDVDKQGLGDGVIDANSILQVKGDKFLADLIKRILSDAQEDFSSINNATNCNTPSEAAQVNSANNDKATEKKFTYRDFTEGTQDLGNAQRLLKFIDGRAKWLKEMERWLIWEPTPEFKFGGVWVRYSKENSSVSPFANKFAAFLKAELKEIKTNTEILRRKAYEIDENDCVKALKDEAAAKQYRKALDTKEIVNNIHISFCKSHKVGAAITMLKSEESIRIRFEDLDRYPRLLNCRNGVIDLESGKFYRADPKLLLTQQISVDYDPRADSTFIEEFFKQIQPDEMTRAGLLRWLGYCLSGSVREEKFLIWRGSGGNGKGVLSRTIAALMRDYAASIPRNALVLHKFDGGSNAHTAALNALINARFCISEELSQSSMLDASLLKALTGGDLQTFRKLFGEFAEVIPTAKLNMSSNFLPRFENTDDRGMERRMLIMPFAQSFAGDKADPRLKEKMMLPENLRGLLKLLVDEAGKWFRDGLIVSAAMKDATRQSIAENDFVKDFLDEYTETNSNGKIPRKVLIQQLRDKCRDAARFSDRQLTDMVKKRGIAYIKTEHGAVFSGIKLVTEIATFEEEFFTT